MSKRLVNVLIERPVWAKDIHHTIYIDRSIDPFNREQLRPARSRSHLFSFIFCVATRGRHSLTCYEYIHIFRAKLASCFNHCKIAPFIFVWVVFWLTLTLTLTLTAAVAIQIVPSLETSTPAIYHIHVDTPPYITYMERNVSRHCIVVANLMLFS